MNKITSTHILYFYLFLFTLILPINGYSAEQQASSKSHDQGKRSYIQSVDGYAYLSEDMTLSETRSAAFANAKRQAIEMALTSIKTYTRVEDFILKKDIVEGKSEGAVTILEQKDHGVENNVRYHVWIKAEVKYELSSEKKPDKNNSANISLSSVVMDKNGPLTVKVWTLKKQYKDGETVTVFIQGNRDFYAKIVNITSSGNIIQLLPNDYRTTTFFEGGEVYKIPDKEDRFKMKISPPYGEDKIIVYASEVPVANVSMESIGQGLNMYRGKPSSFASKTRGISIAPSTPSKNSGVAFYEASTTFRSGD